MAVKDNPKVKVITKDDQVFELDAPVAKHFGTIRNVLDSFASGDAKDQIGDEPIPLELVVSPIFKKVLEWVEHYKDDAKVMSPDDDETLNYRSDDIPVWDQEFLRVDQGTLFEILLAANFLEVKGLLDMCCKTVAKMMKGKSVEEIRKQFNIVNDFTPEEEEAFKREDEWFEKPDD